VEEKQELSFKDFLQVKTAQPYPYP